MSPDDPRHGTTRGFYAGCRELCCRRAMNAYEKVCKFRRANGIVWAIPALGVQRRIQALMALGWDAVDIAADAGFGNRNQIWMILKGQKGKPCRWVERKTWVAVCESYERLSMRLPPPDTKGKRVSRTRVRNLAARNGWLPPLAWDDIDDPSERPSLTAEPEAHWNDTIDHAVIERVIVERKRPRKLTRAESAEVLRRLRARGLSTAEIEDGYGIKPERYERGAA